MTIEQIKVLRLVASAIIEAVEASGHTGAPAGHLYAALMRTGMSLHQFQQIMETLTKKGFLRKDGHVYFSTGREFNPALPAVPSPAPAPAAPRGWEQIEKGVA